MTVKRKLARDQSGYAEGLVRVSFSFVCNGASDPTITYTSAGTTARGAGVATVTHSATGDYLVTLSDSFRYIVTKIVHLEDISSNDGAYATAGPASNEGTATAISFHVYTRANASATKTDFTVRRVYVSLECKNTGLGY